ncbi:MAG TPA: ABC transporter ATP-binding protein [Acidimicrobiales bacterium]|nr:ABC transporter ATP-binding protein [Acidimicrobiales bacterium]
MTDAIETTGLTKRYGRRVALSECTLSIPTGKVVGLVGPNGAGKTTLMHLAVGLLEPSAGGVRVLGHPPAEGPEQLGHVGFVAQNTPLYAYMSVADHLRFGGWVNPTWDQGLAEQRIERLGLDLHQKAGTLSGGQRAQLALTLGIAKRPELLMLDEPVASLDPLARREFLQALMAIAVEHGVSIVLSSHLVADLERVCDYLVVLVGSRVQITGDIETLLAHHHRLIAPRREGLRLPSSWEVIEKSDTERQSTLIVRHEEPIHDPAWTVEQLDLEDLVLAYMGRAVGSGTQFPALVGATS